MRGSGEVGCGFVVRAEARAPGGMVKELKERDIFVAVVVRRRALVVRREGIGGDIVVDNTMPYSIDYP